MAVSASGLNRLLLSAQVANIFLSHSMLVVVSNTIDIKKPMDKERPKLRTWDATSYLEHETSQLGVTSRQLFLHLEDYLDIDLQSSCRYSSYHQRIQLPSYCQSPFHFLVSLGQDQECHPSYYQRTHLFTLLQLYSTLEPFSSNTNMTTSRIARFWQHIHAFSSHFCV